MEDEDLTWTWILFFASRPSAFWFRCSTRCFPGPAMMTTLAGLVVVLMMVVQKISDLFHLVKGLFGL